MPDGSARGFYGSQAARRGLRTTECPAQESRTRLLVPERRQKDAITSEHCRIGFGVDPGLIGAIPHD